MLLKITINKQSLLTKFPVEPTSMTVNDKRTKNLGGDNEFTTIVGRGAHFKSELRVGLNG